MKKSGIDRGNVRLKHVTTILILASFYLQLHSAQAQTTIYSEGFNTPGDGTRYQLLRDYYEVSQPNNLWTTVPNQLPGDAVIVYLEPGDEYFDGSTVPARRATFFADNDLGDNTPGVDLTEEGFTLFDATINWASGTDGSSPLSINFVIDDDSDIETNNLDVTLVERLLDQGHDVTVTNADEPPVDTDDLIFMASHDNGSAVGSIAPEFKTISTPLITGFFHAAGPLGFGSERGENTNGTWDLQIVDSTHPLAGGFPQGIVRVVEDDAARQRFTRVTRGTMAPDAKVVATLPGSVIDTPEDFTNFEGEGYLRGGHSTWNNAPEAGEPRVLQTPSINTKSVGDPKLMIDLAASGDLESGVGPYEDPIVAPENFDFLRILTDNDDDGEFDLLAEFTAHEEFETDFPGFLQSSDGTVVLNPEFQTLTFDLPAADALNLRVEVFTNAGDERVGIDNLRVTGEGPTCNPNTMGDIDGSGDVAFADFLILSANFGKTGVDHTLGDIDCSGDVAFADFLILSGNFGQNVGGVATVPEPELPWLACSIIVLGMLHRRSSRRHASTRRDN